MYDVPGGDSGREWVEVENAGSETVDISSWTFLENGSHHKLSLAEGAGIAPGGYAVIADDPTKFLVDWPSYSGVLYDSSFSLSNSGEPLALLDDSGSTAASVTYDPTLGAAGDGNTLQWDSTKWIAAPATPGSAYVARSALQDSPAVAAGVATAGDTPAPSTAPSVKQQIFASAGPSRTVFVGADSAFTATAIGLAGEPLPNARYIWTFGDGGRMEGQSVSYHYNFPGTYVVVLDVASGGYSTEARVIVTALPADISIPFVSTAVTEIQNNSVVELDLGGWMLASEGKTFTFPSHTIVGAHEAVMIANARAGLSPKTPEALVLEYPNGAFAASYQIPLVAARMPAGTNVAAGAVAPAATPIKTSATLLKTPTSTSVPSAPTGSQAAAVVESTDPPVAEAAAGGMNALLPWIAGLALIVALGAGGLYFFMGDEMPATKESNTEDDASVYEIEEIA